MLIGYARVSTADQSLKSQKDELKKAGCNKIFTDKASGVRTERPGLIKAIDFARKKDMLVVCRLDRLGRSLKHLIEVMNDLQSLNIGFRSLQENIDTTTSGGKLIFHVFGALAEFEREIIRERTKAGLAAARSRGKLGGRKQKFKQSDIDIAIQLYNEKKQYVGEICDSLNMSRTTFYRFLKRYQSDEK